MTKTMRFKLGRSIDAVLEQMHMRAMERRAKGAAFASVLPMSEVKRAIMRAGKRKPDDDDGGLEEVDLE
jgi:hypothetical protein